MHQQSLLPFEGMQCFEMPAKAPKPRQRPEHKKQHGESRIQRFLDQLDLPLFGGGVEVLLERVEELCVPAPHVANPSESDVFIHCEHSDWEVDDVINQHSDVLWASLGALATCGNSEEKLNVLEWVYTPSRIERLGHRKVELKWAIDIPFSFERCCRFENLNPDRVRGLLAEYLPQEIKRAALKFMGMA